MDSQNRTTDDLFLWLAKPQKSRLYGRAKAMLPLRWKNEAFLADLFHEGYCVYLKMRGLHARVRLRESA